MKIAYKHIIEHIDSKPSIEEISNNLFQLGHEHEIEDNIFKMEFTPNRGDCLSINGLLNDLGVFHEINFKQDFYKGDLKSFDIDFINNAKEECPYISFLKIQVEKKINFYKGPLNDYFTDFNLNKNNFFTDISNYISYETGQPTHCYDASKIDKTLLLEKFNKKKEFETLLDKKIVLKNDNLVFLNGDEIINLAGVIGGKSTSCSENTNSVLVECAYFKPESIIGKSVKYDIQSEAAHKFERGVDSQSQEKILRRFIKIVEDHAVIKKIEFKSFSQEEYKFTYIPYRLDQINKITGMNLENIEYENCLSRLGFSVSNSKIKVPSRRSDISTQNDLAEEIARSIGYDNIPVRELNILKNINQIERTNEINESKVKSFLIDNGYYEVINNPFSDNNDLNRSLKVDNPLDSNKKFLRTELKESLIKNMLYNEKRQKDSIKLFEISDIYLLEDHLKKKKVLGVISSGRLGNNYEDFSKNISLKSVTKFFSSLISHKKLKFEEISRQNLDSKSKNTIIYLEIELDEISSHLANYQPKSKMPSKYPIYKPISEFPSSNRDLSFSLKDYGQLKNLEKLMSSYKNEIIKEIFIFDYYKNMKMNEIKVGYRLVFQSQNKTITDIEVNSIIDDIVKSALTIKTLTLPGRK